MLKTPRSRNEERLQLCVTNGNRCAANVTGYVAMTKPKSDLSDVEYPTKRIYMFATKPQ